MTDIFPGDILVYSGRYPIDWIIMTKTWSQACHVEVYIGGDKSVAARWPRIAVYPLRKRGLINVLRPVGKLDMAAGTEWFYSHAEGLPYAFWELANFCLPFSSINVRGMVCSPLAARFIKHCGQLLFAPDYNFDKIAPADFLKLPPSILDHVWGE